MATMKKSKWLKWLLLALGVIVLGVIAFFVVKALLGDGRSFKEYNTEQTVDGISVKLNSVETLPMDTEDCQERVVLFGNVEDFNCIIANVTITNNTSEEYDYSYRNFGYIDPATKKFRLAAITRISFEGIDITKDMAPGDSHTQDVFYTMQKKDKLSDVQLIYMVNPKTQTQISLQL